MFSLKEQQVRLADVNPRSELHGQEHVPALDLKVEMKVSNDVLSEFDPALKGAMYARPAEPDLADNPTHMPVLRFPMMSAFKWSKEFAGYVTTIHYGMSGTADIVLGDCAVDNFKFECLDGGTVVVSFRIIAHPDADAIGRLCTMVQQDVTLSLDPPEASAQGEL